MWTASVTSVTKQPTVILVDIEYTNGINSFTETYKLYSAPIDIQEWLKRTATDKLNRLNGLEITDIPLGSIEEWTDPDPEYTKMLRTLQKLNRIKLLVDAKVVQETDQRVISFIQNLRSKVDTYWDKL